MAAPDYLGSLAAYEALRGTATQVDATTFSRYVGLASRYVDRITGWPAGVFSSRAGLAFYVDGTGELELRLPLPPISIDSVEYVEQRSPESLDEVDATDYVARTSRPPGPDERRDPRIEHLGAGWREGPRLYVVTGTFGFVDEDGDTPLEIADVVSRLVELLTLAELDPNQALSDGMLESMRVDRFAWKKAEGAVRTGGLTGLPEIDGVLMHFRPAPRGGAAIRSARERNRYDTTRPWRD